MRIVPTMRRRSGGMEARGELGNAESQMRHVLRLVANVYGQCMAP